MSRHHDPRCGWRIFSSFPHRGKPSLFHRRTSAHMPSMGEIAALLGPCRINPAGIVRAKKTTGTSRLVHKGELGAIRGKMCIPLDKLILGKPQLFRQSGNIKRGQQNMPAPAATSSTALAGEGFHAQVGSSPRAMTTLPVRHSSTILNFFSSLSMASILSLSPSAMMIMDFSVISTLSAPK